MSLSIVLVCVLVFCRMSSEAANCLFVEPRTIIKHNSYCLNSFLFGLSSRVFVFYSAFVSNNRTLSPVEVS